MMPVRVLLVLVFLGTSSFLSNRLTEPVHPLVASIMAKFERILYTGKNNGFPFLDIFGYLKNTHKNPKFGRVRQVQSGNLVGNSLVGTCLTLPNLGFLWVFFKYPKIISCDMGVFWKYFETKF